MILKFLIRVGSVRRRYRLQKVREREPREINFIGCVYFLRFSARGPLFRCWVGTCKRCFPTYTPKSWRVLRAHGGRFKTLGSKFAHGYQGYLSIHHPGRYSYLLTYLLSYLLGTVSNSWALLYFSNVGVRHKRSWPPSLLWRFSHKNGGCLGSDLPFNNSNNKLWG